MRIDLFLVVLLLGFLAAVGCDRSPDEDGMTPAPTGEARGSGDSLAPAPDASADAAVVEWQEVMSGDGRWRVAWRPVAGPLPVSEPCAIDLRITDAAGRPLEDRVEVVFDAEMPHHGHGMNVEPRVTRRDDVWLVEGVLLHMPGRWEASVDVAIDGEIERAQWTMDIER